MTQPPFSILRPVEATASAELSEASTSNQASRQQATRTESGLHAQTEPTDPLKTLQQRAELMLDQLKASLEARGQSMLEVERWQQLAVELDCRIRDCHAMDGVRTSPWTSTAYRIV